MNKHDILDAALTGRDQEILGYQVNIDNYVRAIAKINAEHADNLAMTEFRDHLANMLESHKTEQLKAIVIRDVIAEQLTEMRDS
jgi:hypothetical protein